MEYTDLRFRDRTQLERQWGILRVQVAFTAVRLEPLKECIERKRSGPRTEVGGGWGVPVS